MEHRTQHDVAVIGGGLAGLVAATRLAQLGRSVLLLEANAEVGGLCRSVELDGRRVAIGCNDFGAGLSRLLAQLGIELSWQPSRTRFLVGERWIRLPPDAMTLLRLLPRVVELLGVLRRLRRADDDAWLLEEAGARSPILDAILRLLPYALGAPDMPVHLLRSTLSRELDYGYQASVVPVGGAHTVSAALGERFVALGGRLRLGTRCTAVERDGDFCVRTDDGEVRARAVVSSRPRPPEGVPDPRPGLSAASVHLAVDVAHPWPRGLHALGWMPAPIGEWMGALDRGEAPPRFGFHAFHDGAPPRDGCYGVTAFFFVPRGRTEPDAAERATHAAILDEGLDAIAPGLHRHIRHRRVLYPDAYRRLVGCDPQPARWAWHPGLRKPAALDPATGIVHVGTSAGPPGDHAGTAALSGWRAAADVHGRLA